MSNIPDSSQPSPTPSASDSFNIEIITDDNVDCFVSDHRLQEAVVLAAKHRGYSSGVFGIRVTDDLGIHEVNRDHLGHDYPTDVISFPYRDDQPLVEGELIVSVDTARQRASELGWPAENELLLYVVHGVLHITGMDDHETEDRIAMRKAEHQVMTALGVPDISRFAADREDADSSNQRLGNTKAEEAQP